MAKILRQTLQFIQMKCEQFVHSVFNQACSNHNHLKDSSYDLVAKSLKYFREEIITNSLNAMTEILQASTLLNKTNQKSTKQAIIKSFQILLQNCQSKQSSHLFEQIDILENPHIHQQQFCSIVNEQRSLKTKEEDPKILLLKIEYLFDESKLQKQTQNSQLYFFETIKDIELRQQNEQYCPTHANEQLFYKYYNNSVGHYERRCNTCVYNSRRQQQQGILCLRHNKIIQFAVVDNNDQVQILENQPTYLCQICPKNNLQFNIHYKRIDYLHYRPVKYIKINYQSFRNTRKYPNHNKQILQQFLLCDKCDLKDAVKINSYELQKRMDRSDLQHQDRILSFLKSIEGLIRLQQFDKIKNYFINDSKLILTFFEALQDSILCRSKNIYQKLTDHTSSNQQIEKIIEKLTYIQKYKIKDKTSEQIMKFTQFYNDFIHQQSQYQLVKISQGLQRLKKSIQKQIEHNLFNRKIEQTIKNKYKRIVNKLKYSEFIITPCLLIQVQPSYYCNVFQIFIVKEFEDDLEAALKKEQSKYYQQKWTQYYESNKIDNQVKQNWLIFSKQTNYYKLKQYNLENQIKFQNRKNGKKAIILDKINNFPNLTKLTIIYNHFKCEYSDFDYEIQSIELIEILLKKQRIKMVQLYGIKINNMMQLIEQLYINQHSYQNIITLIHSKKITLHLKARIQLESLQHLLAFAFFASLFQKVINFTLSFINQQILLQRNQLNDNFFACQDPYEHQKQIREEMIQRLKKMNLKSKLENQIQVVWKKPFNKSTNQIFIQCLCNLQKTNIQINRESFYNTMNEQFFDPPPKSINSLTFKNITITFNMYQNITKLLQKNHVIYLSFTNCIHSQHVVKSIKNSIVAVQYNNCSMSIQEINQLLKRKSQMIQLKLENVSLQERTSDNVQTYVQSIKLDFLKRIVNLHLINCDWVTDQIMAKLPKNCYKSIEILKLTYCSRLTSRTIQNTVSNFERLNTLDICSTNIQVSSLLQLKTRELAHLEIGNSTVNQEVLSLVDRKWPTIFTLNIYGCANISDKVLEVGFKHLGKLYLQRSKISFYKLKQLRLRGVQILPSYQYGIDLYLEN